MKRRMFFVLLAGMVLLMGCTDVPKTTVPPTLATTESTVSNQPLPTAVKQLALTTDNDMMALFVQNCAACHGPDGDGTVVAPPLNSAELRARLNEEEIRNTITNGRPGTAMPAWGGTLTPEQIHQLAELVAHWDETGEEVAVNPSEETTTGAATAIATPTPASPVTDNAYTYIANNDVLTLFAQNCATCHGANGGGTTIAPPLNSDELRARLSEEQIRSTITNGRPGTAMPAWGGYLTPEQIYQLTELVTHWNQLGEEELAELARSAPVNSGRGYGMGGGMMGNGMMNDPNNRWGAGSNMGGRHGNGGMGRRN